VVELHTPALDGRRGKAPGSADRARASIRYFPGLLLAAAVGSVMSGASSFLLAGATTFVNDLHIPFRGGQEDLSEAHLVGVTRATIPAFGLLAATIAYGGIDIITIDTPGTGIMSVPFAGIVSMLWDGTTREAGLPGFVGGGVVFVVRAFVLGEPALFGEGPSRRPSRRPRPRWWPSSD
jgi:SSS family solute:Na+ symporter